MNFITRLLIKVVVVIHFLFTASVLFAQFPVIENFTVNDGLPSSEIYDITQDSAGYIWLATENGISKYDGYQFRNFTKPEGLPSNSVLKLYVDYKNRLWFSTYQGEVGYIVDDQIVVHWISSDSALRNHEFYDHIFVDTNETIYLTGFSGVMVTIRDNEYSYDGRFKFSEKQKFKYVMFYKERAGQFIFGFANITLKTIEEVKKLFPGYNFVNFTFKALERSSLLQKNIIKVNDSTTLISFGQELVCLVDNKEKYRKIFDHEIVTLNCDKHNNLWVGLKFGGIFMYHACDLLEDPVHFLKNTTISNVIQDQEGSYWFTSTDYGVFYVAAVNFVTYDKEMLDLDDEVIHTLAIHDNDLYFSTSNMGLYKAELSKDNLKINKNFSIEGEITSTIADILISSENQLWITATQYLRYDLDGKRIRNFATNRRHSGYSIIELFSEEVLIGVSNGYYQYNPDNSITFSGNHGFKQKTFCFHQSPDSTLWLGTLNGLYVKKGDQVKPYDRSSIILGSRISAIEETKNFLIVGTFDNGLALIDRKSKKAYFINESKGLISHRVKSIFADGDKIWIGTNQGLSELTFDTQSGFEVAPRNFTIWDGLPSNEINDIVKYGDNLILATNKGIVRFNPNSLSINPYFPEIRLESVRVNDLTKNFKETDGIFNNKQNNIEINFRLKSFKNPQKASYLYKLEGYENEWYLTRNTSVRYPKLNPGKYSFVVKAKSYAGEWSNTVAFDFVIKKHFTQYLSFRISMIVAIGSIIFLIVYMVVATFRNREELKRQAILAEQKAVRSQMNPHFIFNSLNSIQNFIVEKDDKNANLYLVIFSSLIRRILEASKHNFISLKEEIETIKLYLELEKFRFEKYLDYTIEVDSSINADQVSIPSMLLQPYLENAIWHGIVPKQSKGMLLVKFEQEQAGLMKISIIDDGIGRIKAGEINKRRKHHKPTGMKNVEERLGLLNKLNNTNMEVKIIDIYDEQNEAKGTQVEFFVEI